MKKLLSICLLSVCLSSFASGKSMDTSQEEDVYTCIEIAMDLANIDLANGDITTNEYFGQVNYYMSICNER